MPMRSCKKLAQMNTCEVYLLFHLRSSCASFILAEFFPGGTHRHISDWLEVDVVDA